MKMSSFTKVLFLLIAALLTNSVAFSQGITGKVTDAYFSDPLPGAIVRIPEVNAGVETDLDGNYEITGIKAGTYTVEVSYVGYTTVKFTDVVVKSDGLTRLDVPLSSDDGITTDEITIEASTSTANEQAMLLEQKNADQLQDGISSQQIKRAPDSQASDVLKRVIGVNIVDNKFVYVRGTSERYSNTTLNGVELPSTETDKKSFTFDLFPSNLLDNIIIAKSYTVDKPANFSGGLVQLNTIEFPESFTLKMSTSGAYNSNTTGDDFSSYDAGEKKFLFFNLGIDNGDRTLPSSVPSFRVDRLTLNSQQIKSIGQSFRNDWGQNESSAPPNSGLQISMGNKMDVLGNPFGYFGAYTYGSGFQNMDIQRWEYQQSGDLEQQYSGLNSQYSVRWGAIANMSYKIGINNKISFKNSYVLNSKDETQFLSGFNVPQDYDRHLYLTKFSEKTVFSTLVEGSHYIDALNKMNFTWRGSYSESTSNEPDRKTMQYQRQRGTDDPFNAGIAVTNNPNTNSGGRFFSELHDFNRSFEANIEMPFHVIKSIDSKTKLGVYANGKQRSFDARLFAPYFTSATNIFERNRINYLPIDSIFVPENFDTTKLYIGEFTRPSDNYQAEENNYAGYLMFDVPIEKLRVVIGARLESNEQILTTFQDDGTPLNVNLKNNDILPSVNMIFALNDKTNIRGSYFQSISRPELRELAPFGYIDFNTNIYVFGNPNLRRTLIRNYDLRYEVFPEAGEIMSVSLFYKHIDAPIEKIFDQSSGSDSKSATFDNAESGANNYGIEFEIRKNLAFISKTLSLFTFNGNFTLVNSKVDISGLGGSENRTERRLQGQSPYTINVGLYYDNPNTGTSANLLYNRAGKRISEVGINDLGDVEENGRNLIDFSISQKFLTRFSGKFSIGNLLGEDEVYTQDVLGTEQTVRIFKRGTNVSLTLGYDF